MSLFSHKRWKWVELFFCVCVSHCSAAHRHPTAFSSHALNSIYIRQISTVSKHPYHTADSWLCGVSPCQWRERFKKENAHIERDVKAVLRCCQIQQFFFFFLLSLPFPTHASRLGHSSMQCYVVFSFLCSRRSSKHALITTFSVSLLISVLSTTGIAFIQIQVVQQR